MKIYKIAQVNEKDIPSWCSWARYDGVTRGKAIVEVYKNPDQTTINKIRRSQTYGDEVGVLVTRGNVYAFRRDLELHYNVARKIGLSEYVGVLLGIDYAMITDATTQSLKHTKEAVRLVRGAFPNVEDISYYDEAIVGDWEDEDI